MSGMVPGCIFMRANQRNDILGSSWNDLWFEIRWDEFLLKKVEWNERVEFLAEEKQITKQYTMTLFWFKNLSLSFEFLIF